MDLLTQCLETFRRIVRIAASRNQPGMSQAQLLALVEKTAADQAGEIDTFKLMLKRETNDNVRQD